MKKPQVEAGVTMQKMLAERRMVEATKALHEHIAGQMPALAEAAEKLRARTVDLLGVVGVAAGETQVRYEELVRSVLGAGLLPRNAMDSPVRAADEELAGIVRAIVSYDPDPEPGTPLGEFYVTIEAAARPAVGEAASSRPMVSRERMSEITGLPKQMLREVVARVQARSGGSSRGDL
ncbi:hypothetical protein ACWEN6_13845 [Sphaerisporangium sp. NPDC004334]